jgi:hypothetical protein
MENDASPAPRSDVFSLVMPLFDGLPKGSVLLLLATASWFFGTLSIVSLWRGMAFLAHHWPL